MKKFLPLFFVVVLSIGILPTSAFASSWHDLDSVWRIRLDPPHGSSQNKWHVHVEKKNGSEKSAENVDGSKHDGQTLDSLPKGTRDKARSSSDYKKGKENQEKTDQAKKEIAAKKLNWKNAVHWVIIVAILVAFGLLVYFTGGAAAVAAALVL